MRWWPRVGEVLDALAEEDLATPPDRQAVADALADEDPPPPWYVRLGLGALAWFASWVLLLSCVPLITLSGWLLAAVGGILFLGATVLRWARPRSIAGVADPTAVAIAVAGRLQIAGGLIASGVEEWVVMGGMASLEVLAVLAVPDRVHRAFATVLACGWLALLLAWTEVGPLLDGFLGLVPALAAIGVLVRPVIASTVLRHVAEPVTVALAVFGLGAMGRFWGGWADEGWILSLGVGTGVLAAGVVGTALWRSDAPVGTWVAALLATALVVAFGLGLPGLTVALAFTVLAFLVRDGPLLVVSLLALVAFGIWATVAVDLPVVAKGLALSGTGAVLLGLRAWLRRRVPAEEVP